MKIHFLVTKSSLNREWRGSLCGRLNKASTDGMNVTHDRSQVTCGFCLRALAAAIVREG